MIALLAELLPRCSFPTGALQCAVSGGADSLALLALACATGQPVTAIHVDHGLRAGSDREAAVVEAAAKQFGASFVSKSVTVALGPNLEGRARAARYGVLPDDVLTGHTADDHVETVLMNLMRGAGLDGLAGMRAEGHPILKLRRVETHALCAELWLRPVDDPSNTDPSILRNRVRHELLPLMNDLVHRDVTDVIARQTPHLREAGKVMDALVEGVDPTDAKAVGSLPDALAHRVLRPWLANSLDAEQHPASSAAVARVLAVARGEAKGCDVTGGVRVVRSQQRLRLISNRPTGL